MEKQLEQLEAKITLLIQANVALRAENQQLHEQQSQLKLENSTQSDKLDQVKTRLEKLLGSLPEDDEITTDNTPT